MALWVLCPEYSDGAQQEPCEPVGMDGHGWMEGRMNDRFTLSQQHARFPWDGLGKKTVSTETCECPKGSEGVAWFL